MTSPRHPRPVLAVRGLQVSFPSEAGRVNAVRGMSFEALLFRRVRRATPRPASERKSSDMPLYLAWLGAALAAAFPSGGLCRAARASASAACGRPPAMRFAGGSCRRREN